MERRYGTGDIDVRFCSMSTELGDSKRYSYMSFQKDIIKTNIRLRKVQSFLIRYLILQ